MPLPDHDMYGHKIWPLGETGWGMSVSYHQKTDNYDEVDVKDPHFTLFHESDPNPQQCLVTLSLHGTEERPQICNVFDKRVEEVETHNAHAQRTS